MYREEERQRGSCDGSLPKRLQQLKLSQSEARNFYQVSHAGAGSQSFGLSSTAFPGHRHIAGWKRATRIRTSAHTGSQCVQGKDFNHYAITLGLPNDLAYWTCQYSELITVF